MWSAWVAGKRRQVLPVHRDRAGTPQAAARRADAADRWRGAGKRNRGIPQIDLGIFLGETHVAVAGTPIYATRTVTTEHKIAELTAGRARAVTLTTASLDRAGDGYREGVRFHDHLANGVDSRDPDSVLAGTEVVSPEKIE